MAADPPPPAPSPPPTTPAVPPSSRPNGSSRAPNVFDFLDHSSATPTDRHGQMKMVAHAPSVFEQQQLTRFEGERDDDSPEDYDLAYEENGFSYGAGPIPPAPMPHNEVSNVSLQFMTPAPKPKRRDRTPRDHLPPPSLEHSRTSSLTGTTSDKKRKRGQQQDNMIPQDDTPMADAPSNSTTPALNHSGLTGGLSQLMRTQYSVSPDRDRDRHRYEPSDDQAGYTHPASPIKRTRRGNNHSNKDNAHHGENGLGISVKGGGGGGAGRKLISLLGGATGVTGGAGSSNDPSSKALLRTRRRSSSDGAGDEKARKALRKQKHRSGKDARKRGTTSTALVRANGAGHDDDDDDDDSDEPRRLKAIEYNKDHKDKDKSKDRDENNQLVLYNNKDEDKENGSDDADPADESTRRDRASQFLALVNKGPDSERGFSVHKALKRYHRDYSSSRGSDEHGQHDQRDRGRDRDRDRERDRRGRGRGRTHGHGHGHGRSSSRDVTEKDLWRLLRLKRNERGEVVVFI